MLSRLVIIKAMIGPVLETIRPFNIGFVMTYPRTQPSVLRRPIERKEHHSDHNSIKTRNAKPLQVEMPDQKSGRQAQKA